MDLKESLQNILELFENRRTDSRLLLVIGVLGIGIIVATVWLAVNDWRSQQVISQITLQQQEIVDQLARPVQALKRIMNDEQVQALAVRAIETPATVEDLRSYLQGRINEISQVGVLGSDLASIGPGKLGLSGYAVLDMLLNLQENINPLLQLHSSLVPPLMVDAVQIMSGDNLVGYMIVTLEPGYLLSHFNPDYSLLGYIGLSQYNGRQPSNILAELGNRSLVGQVPERLSVPGTLFRVEFPHRQYTAVLSGSGILLVLLLAGVLFVAVAAFLHRYNRSLEKAQPVATEGTASVLAVRPDVEQPARGPCTNQNERGEGAPRRDPVCLGRRNGGGRGLLLPHSEPGCIDRVRPPESGLRLGRITWCPAAEQAAHPHGGANPQRQRLWQGPVAAAPGQAPPEVI